MPELNNPESEPPIEQPAANSSFDPTDAFFVGATVGIIPVAIETMRDNPVEHLEVYFALPVVVGALAISGTYAFQRFTARR